MSNETIVLRPIATVRCPRTDIIEDHWGSVVSTIVLDSEQFSTDALQGLDAFSHIEVVYHFHLVDPDKVHWGARQPRGRADFPVVGIMAQRAKARPNRLAVSRCALVGVSGLEIQVKGLDALDGTPVLDVKPYLAEFGPRGPVIQPEWSREVMKSYYLE